MLFDKLEFTTVTSSERVGSEELFFNLQERGSTIVITLNKGSQKKMVALCDGFSEIELKVSGDKVFAIKPLPKKEGKQARKSTNQFTVTALRDHIKDIPFKTRLKAVEYKGMLVCDLRGAI